LKSAFTGASPATPGRLFGFPKGGSRRNGEVRARITASPGGKTDPSRHNAVAQGHKTITQGRKTIPPARKRIALGHKTNALGHNAVALGSKRITQGQKKNL
jgi:hypothetical protein